MLKDEIQQITEKRLNLIHPNSQWGDLKDEVDLIQHPTARRILFRGMSAQRISLLHQGQQH
ncbi:hypothetical protein [Streptomyces canus]|uniref:hypothetical protein n=1 Tax=Streptomyces canus TaxID=58343 RepID=UPI0032506C1D